MTTNNSKDFEAVATPGPWRVGLYTLTQSHLRRAYEAINLAGNEGLDARAVARSLGVGAMGGGRRQDRVCGLLKRWGLVHFDGRRRCSPPQATTEGGNHDQG